MLKPLIKANEVPQCELVQGSIELLLTSILVAKIKFRMAIQFMIVLYNVKPVIKSAIALPIGLQDCNMCVIQSDPS